MSNRREIHERVLNAGNVDELAAAYADWAGSYDADLTGSMGYRGHVTAAERLMHHLTDTRARILDAGCGTGLVGQHLAAAGVENLDGLDYSPEMLTEARGKQVYRELMQGNLMASLNIPDDSYDAIICVGTLTLGHVGPTAFDELVRITRPGGLLCFTVRGEAWQADDYAGAIDRLVANGAWRCLESFESVYIEEEGSHCQVCVCAVN